MNYVSTNQLSHEDNAMYRVIVSYCWKSKLEKHIYSCNYLSKIVFPPARCTQIYLSWHAEKKKLINLIIIVIMNWKHIIYFFSIWNRRFIFRIIKKNKTNEFICHIKHPPLHRIKPRFHITFIIWAIPS